MRGKKKLGDLSYLDTSSDTVSEDMILEYLAQIISDIYLMGAHGFTEEDIRNRYSNQDYFEDVMLIRK